MVLFLFPLVELRPYELGGLVKRFAAEAVAGAFDLLEAGVREDGDGALGVGDRDDLVCGTVDNEDWLGVGANVLERVEGEHCLVVAFAAHDARARVQAVAISIVDLAGVIRCAEGRVDEREVTDCARVCRCGDGGYESAEADAEQVCALRVNVWLLFECGNDGAEVLLLGEDSHVAGAAVALASRAGSAEVEGVDGVTLLCEGLCVRFAGGVAAADAVSVDDERPFLVLAFRDVGYSEDVQAFALAA